MILTQPTDPRKGETAGMRLERLQADIRAAVTQEKPVHETETLIWRSLLQLGHQLLGEFFHLHGSGDLGPTVALPDGRSCTRLAAAHDRRYVSIFGEFLLSRTVYGSREGQKIDFVPLDNRLQLPAGSFSYVLQDWDQNLCVEESFGNAATVIGRILGLRQHVDSLERMNQHMADGVGSYRDNRPMPQPEDEGDVLVVSADGKGVVMRGADQPRPAHRKKGDQASRKRMAIVGAAYTIDRYVRTPEDVVAALFRDGPVPAAVDRPVPRHKHVWASLPGLVDGEETAAVDIVYPWLLNEVVERNRGWAKELVCLHDGQDSLWDARRRHLPHRNAVDILDLLHVTPRLWQAAHLFHPEGSAAAEQFARERILRVLQGHSDRVVRGLRQMGTKRRLTGAKKKALRTLCAFLDKNRERMRYDAYLAKGYPIASGVIEGACRHLVKDRLERAGMHWKIPGAQAMLDLRSTWINGDWQAYQDYYQERETQRLYPYREIVKGVQFEIAA